ncbi:SDR family oxidoreductase [Subtercola sp. YIM 133946]|uniref:SDR family oxidoreductase n=1 Tax=Subtercola sp. YIM 133946 TaxID=3118909 RepID=UPI002F937A09
MTVILVTGATGQVGVPTAAALRAAGHEVRALSRHAGPGLTVADLLSGGRDAAAARGESDGAVDAAFAGVDTVVHLATTNGRRDVQLAQTVFDASRRAGIQNLVLISIVGIEHLPVDFYRQRVEIERRLLGSGLPHTIQRATQFHSLVERLFTAQRFSPVFVAPALRFQPIDVGEVALKLAALAPAGPQGRMPDIGGPEQLTARQIGRSWARSVGSRRPVVGVRLPGRTFAALGAGYNFVPGEPYGRITFAEYLAARRP